MRTTRICSGQGLTIKRKELSSFAVGLSSSRGSGGMLPQKILKIGYLRLVKVDFPA